MTLTLILTRHAKSDWSSPAQDDHARPLNARGRKAAEKLGTWMDLTVGGPQEVLCSSAERTKETWDLIRKGLDSAGPLRLLPELYLPAPSTLFSVLRTAKQPLVLMVSHNPGIALFAETLLRQPPDHERFFDYPTGATTVIDLEASRWADVIEGSGTTRNFVIPKDLE